MHAILKGSVLPCAGEDGEEGSTSEGNENGDNDEVKQNSKQQSYTDKEDAAEGDDQRGSEVNTSGDDVLVPYLPPLLPRNNQHNGCK